MGSPKSGGAKEDTDVDIVGDSPSNSSGEADPSSSSLGISAYTEGERVFAYHGPRIYESKVQKVEMRKVDNTEEKRYFVHYLGWNKNWDEWVGPERLLKFTEENKKLQEDLKLKQQGTDKNPKSGRSSHMKPKSSADAKMDKEDTRNYVGKGKKRKSDFSIEEKDTISNEKLVKIQIPSTLKKQLVDDWEFVVQLGKLVKLPRSPCVDDIMKRYLDYKLKKEGMIGESVGEILKGLRCYFDKALPVMLLYKMERQQYQEAIKDDVSPSSVYGAEHLLRLFVKLPELLSYANIEEEASTRLHTKLIDLLKFLQKNQSTFFLSAYDNPKGGVAEGSGKDGLEGDDN
ncbi:protein MRG1-like isoform X1 [Papaver somniferum]|uniref:protein MRG1-like isoform X1 n=1 Tax=Papaver somniferum TaxID=3469 RepID=UPI000E6F6C3D|nr:protein MRG1-like isoform X1 [Papaver somniferum]